MAPSYAEILPVRLLWVGGVMNNVIQLSRPKASVETIAELIRLGYLKTSRRHIASAVHEALGRMRDDLSREQATWEHDPPPVA
jgi:hypothetical protein